ncbi:MAG: ribonuclease Z [Bacteroidia bacterium]
MGFYVQILGTSGAMPAHGRHQSAQWVFCHGLHFLVDCGEGTQYRIQAHGLNLHKIDAILISHFHGDHTLGLVGVLSSLNLQNKVTPLWVVGPWGLRRFIHTNLQLTATRLRYSLQVFEIPPLHKPLCIWETDRFVVYAFPLQHGVPAQGYLFREKPMPPRMNREALTQLGLDKKAMQQLYLEEKLHWQGRWLRKEDYLLPPASPRSYAYCSDTRYYPEMITWLKKVTMLYHESTFPHSMEARAYHTFHATARQAAQIAQAAQVQKLLLGHFSARFKDLSGILREAKEIFANTEIAQEGKIYSLE